MTKRVSAFVAFVAIGVLCVSTDASAYCRSSSRFWASNAPIRVVVHQDLYQQMQHADGTQWTSGEVDRAVELAIARLNDSAGADVPHVYLDTSARSTCSWYDVCDDIYGPPWGSCYQPNTIVIIPSNCLPTQITFSSTNAHLIHIQRTWASSGGGAPMFWGHTIGGNAVFEITTLHEIGHSLGLGHPDGSLPVHYPTCTSFSSACPAGAFACAVMLNDALASWANDIYTLDDANGLRALYGVRQPPSQRFFESSNLTSVVELPASGTIDSAGYYAASSDPSSPTTNSVTLAGYLRSTSAPGRIDVFSWNWSTLSLTDIGGPLSILPATGPVGSAQTSTSRIVAGHVLRTSFDARHTTRRILQASTPLTSVSWSTTTSDPISGSVADTRVAGLSSAFHSPSSSTIYAFRSDGGFVLLQGNRAGTWSNVINTGIRSLTTPSIACTASGACLLTGVETPRPIRQTQWTLLQWAEFTWAQSGSSATLNGGVSLYLITTNFRITGQMSLAAVRRSSGPGEFALLHVVANGPDTEVYLYRKTPGTSNPFTLFGQVAFFSQARAFAASGGTSTDAEMYLLSH